MNQTRPMKGKQNAHMDKTNAVSVETQVSVGTEGQMDLEQLLRKGDKRLLLAIENEVKEFVGSSASVQTEDVPTTNPIESAFATVRPKPQRGFASSLGLAQFLRANPRSAIP